MAKVVQLHGRTKRTFKVGFLPLEQFTLIALSSAIEPLRMANHLTGEALYDWQLIRPAIAPVTASGGTSMLPNACLNDAGDLEDTVEVYIIKNSLDGDPDDLWTQNGWGFFEELSTITYDNINHQDLHPNYFK